MFARFICATILHLSLVDEVNAGIINMKFAVNHPYKFESVFFAWLAGFLQCISGLTVELANIGVICGANDTINIAQFGAGQVTFAQGAGVTINSTGATATAPKLRVQWSSASIICTASNTFLVVGDIA